MKKYIGMMMILTIILSIFTFEAAASGTVLRAVVMTGDVSYIDEVMAELKILDPSAEIVYIYTQIPGGGFAADINSAVLEKIKKLEGVRNAYVSPVIKGEFASEAGLAGMMSPNNTEYRGEGMVVAVIDAEFYTGHELFVLSPDTVPRLTKEAVDNANLSVPSNRSPYLNEKIPFAYDYISRTTNIKRAAEGDMIHGTHVAGIIGANKLGSPDDGFDGIVPEAQLVFMNIGDKDGYIDFAASIAAINDAIMLKVDVINLSWGSEAGFSNPAADADYFAILSMAQTQGIDVAASAGNESRIGYLSAYYKNYGISDPLASNPDSGLVASPSTLDPVMSVASYNSDMIRVKGYIETSEGDKIIYGEAYHIFASQLLKRGSEFEYVYVEEGNYKNKIVITDDISDEALKGLKTKGAVGVLYCVGSNLYAVKSSILPVASITLEDAEKLLDAKEYKLKIYEYEHFGIIANPAAGSISYFSSWGPTPSLNIKPEITAVGGGVYSTSPVRGYESMSGTSMSAPMVTGALAAVKQYMLASDMHDTTNYTARQLLMSAAVPVIDPETGTEFSPRRQGAGLLNIGNAVKTNVVLYNRETRLPKIELGDNLSNKITLEFSARNFSQFDEIFDVNISVLTDGSYYDKESKRYFMSDHSAAFKKVSFTFNFNAEEITVPAMAVVNVQLEITLDPAEIRALSRIFTQGFYIEGFVYLTPRDGGVPLSIPYLGFYGDWDKLPVFDDDFYSQKLGTTILLDKILFDIELGVNIFMEDDVINPLLYAFSPDGDGYGDTLSFWSQALRNYILHGFVISDSRRNIITGGIIDSYRQKAYPVGDYLLTIIDDIWDGRDADNYRYIYPDGKYYLTIYAYSAYNGSFIHEYTVPFYIDTQKPTIKEISASKTALTVSASDNLAIQAVRIYDNKTVDEMILFGSMSAAGEVTVTFDVTGVSGFVYIEVVDYAMNIYTLRILLDD